VAHLTLRTDIINALIQQRQYQTYLEIGVGSGRNFKKVKIKNKISVDPKGGTYQLTSDNFFKDCSDKFDIIFIDGLHLYEQVLRDVKHSLARLSKGGTIILHDCQPKEESHQNRQMTQASWTGDVWKAWALLRMSRSDLKMCVIDTDWGVGIIERGSQQLFRQVDFSNLTWDFYVTNRQLLLNLISLENFQQWLKSF
jgi:hypothetical protein